MDDELSIKPVKKWIREGTERQKHEEIKADLNKMKQAILTKGILHYDDCYILADAYIRKYPFVKMALRKRFKYVFIDETQDLKKYQLDLIDSIFDSDECCIRELETKIKPYSISQIGIYLINGISVKSNTYKIRCG